MLLLQCTSVQSETESHAKCGDNVTLKCSGVESMEFISVAWYKFDKQKPHGIVRRDKGEDNIQDYNFTRPTVFKEDQSLFLSSVVPDDSGLFECEITADLGHTNLHSKVKLTVNECENELMTTITYEQNSTQTPSHGREEDLPVQWSITGVVAVGLAKIILSANIILVTRAVQTWSSRQRRQQW
ncbi:uncharacterized protein LOC123975381 [Xyrichtys novacula]|nr:uncharacterized protein LOC123975381 [Xyrichtys novacula]